MKRIGKYSEPRKINNEEVFYREPVLFLLAFKIKFKNIFGNITCIRTEESKVNPAEILNPALLLCILSVFTNFNSLYLLVLCFKY